MNRKDLRSSYPFHADIEASKHVGFAFDMSSVDGESLRAKNKKILQKNRNARKLARAVKRGTFVLMVLAAMML